jgi:predicted GNAT family N-acyltransferase
MTGNHIVTERVTWSEAKSRLAAIREQVFVKEQKVPLELEMDEHDAHCYHLLAHDGAGHAVGTARLLLNGYIGRMAVLAPYRGRGIGSQLLEATVELAKTQGLNTLYLNAQTHAIGFYEKHQFRVVGEEFMEAGIPHVQMRRQL